MKIFTLNRHLKCKGGICWWKGVKTFHMARLLGRSDLLAFQWVEYQGFGLKLPNTLSLGSVWLFNDNLVEPSGSTIDNSPFLLQVGAAPPVWKLPLYSSCWLSCQACIHHYSLVSQIAPLQKAWLGSHLSWWRRSDYREGALFHWLEGRTMALRRQRKMHHWNRKEIAPNLMINFE